MYKTLNSILIIVFLAGLLSCQKKEEVVVAEEDVHINIISPQEGAVYKKGDTVLIKSNITYSGQLHGYIARITDDEGTVVFEAEGHTHSGNMTIHELWVNNLIAPAGLKLELIAIIDHDESKKTVNVAFSSQP